MKSGLPIIALRGAGDLASGVALRLYHAGFTRIVFLEAEKPLAVRRKVAFSGAVAAGTAEVEGLQAVRVDSPSACESVWAAGKLPVIVDPKAEFLSQLAPEALVDAIIAKRNIGTRKDMAPLVIGLGPGFTAGEDVHCIVETKRGHHLGRVIRQDSAEANTGIPGNIEGHTFDRVYWAGKTGVFNTKHDITDMVTKGDVLGYVDDEPVVTALTGVIRGLLPNGTPVQKGTKLGDVDPRGEVAYCFQVSDKAFAIAGGVLEALCAHILAKHA